MRSNTEQIYDKANTSRRVIKTIVISSKKKNIQTSIEIEQRISLKLIGITKLKKQESECDIKEKKVREEFITYKEPVKQEVKEIIKEKIIIQKEAKPEIAEEGNDRQIFDMKIIKRWP